MGGAAERLSPVSFTLPPGEPAAGPWVAIPFADVVGRVVRAVPGRPWVLAVDGRGAAGKTTLAVRLAAAVPSSAVVSVDDIAWHEPMYEWGSLLREHVLEPLSRGAAVDYRPTAWEERGRPGRIAVPAGLDVVVIEGTGSSQREHADLIDATVWVQSDFAEAERRGIERDVVEGVNGNREETTAFWHEWMAHELRFFEAQRPWERAEVFVTGTPPVDVAPDEIAVADPAQR